MKFEASGGGRPGSVSGYEEHGQTESTVMFTRRTAHLLLREAEEEIALDRHFVEPIGYLDVHITPSDYRIVPTVARVREGFSLRLSRDEVDDAFEVPLVFLMAPQNYKRERAEWNGLITSVYAIPFNDRNIWGATAGILHNLWERIYRG